MIKKAIPDFDENTFSIEENSDFKDLGLDSIAMLELLVQLNNKNLTLDEDKIFKALSVKQLFDCIIPE